MESVPSSPRALIRALVVAAVALIAAAPAAHAQLPPVGDPPPSEAPPSSSPPPSQPAPPPPDPQVRGVQVHPLWDGVSPDEADREARIARQAGAEVVRMDMSWSSLELYGRSRLNRPYLRRADAFVRSARRRGLRVIVTLWGSPCWASSAPASLRQGCRGAWWSRGVEAYPPRKASEYGRIAAWVARRYGDKVAALEIWNEPNEPFFLRGRDPVRSYGSLVRASYKPVKRAAPGVRVLAGAIAYSDGDFLTALYERGRIGGYYDAISYHPYTGGRDPRAPAPPGANRKTSFVDGTEWIREVMAAHGDGGELWMTEIGSSTCRGREVCVDEATQARHVRDFLDIAAGWSFVRAVVVYSLRDSRGPSTTPAGRFGLLRSDLRPKPAWSEFRRALAR